MTLEYILSKKNKFKGVVIDTNLFLLLLYGLFDPSKIGKNGKVAKYTIEDFEKLSNLINHFSTKLLITTNILTEVCNLSDSFNKESGFNFFKFIEETLKNYTEHHEKSLSIIEKDKVAFYKLGISDSSIANLASQNALVITDDLPLYHFLSSKNYHAINYAHLMTL